MENPNWIFALTLLSTLSIFLVFLTTQTSLASSFFLLSLSPSPSLSPTVFVKEKLHPLPTSHLPPPPRLAYFVSGSAGDVPMLRRTLLAIYHPNNRYVLHLDAASPPQERLDLETFVNNHTLFTKFGNVAIIKKPNLVSYKGPTMVANTLHAAAVLLRTGGEWDWFINLSAKDYPLVTQDDLLHTFSSLPRDLNFIHHSGDIEWIVKGRIKPVYVDPGLHSTEKADIFRVTEQRSVPTAFRIFQGSAWMMLSRPFIDFCIYGWDNLPQTLLMYFANFVSSPEAYFHTVICNAEEFRNTTVNSDLHFISWDKPAKPHPRSLTVKDKGNMVDSNVPFARKFSKDNPVLDQIDTELLFRGKDMVVPGGWCLGGTENGTDPCSVVGDITVIQPTAGAKRLQNLMSSLLSKENFRPKQCKL